MRDEKALKLILKNGKLKDALGAVLDLASDSALDPDFYQDNKQLKQVAHEQQMDIGLVADLYSVL